MNLLTKALHAKLVSNFTKQQKAAEINICLDFNPVVKFFTPDAQCIWIITELDPSDNDTAFGICDLGMGNPELGYVSLNELREVRGKLGLPVERDRYYNDSNTISEELNRMMSV